MAVRYRLMFETTRSTQNLPLLQRCMCSWLLSNLIGMFCTTTSQNPAVHVSVVGDRPLRGEYGSEILMDVRNYKVDTKLTPITTMGESLFVVELNRLVLHYYFPEFSHSYHSGRVLTSKWQIRQLDIDQFWRS